MIKLMKNWKIRKYRLMKILKSSFILIAGASAAFSLLAVQYPISKVQKFIYQG